jgi:PAS domain S-box-containing protein
MPTRAVSLGKNSTYSRLAAIVPVAVGTVCLVGWTLRVRQLTSLVPGAVEMKSNTALCLILLGVSLLMLARRTSVRVEALARAMAVLAAAIALVTISEYLFDWNLGIDELVFKDYAGSYNIFRGRMSPYSAGTILMLGLAIASLRMRQLDRAARLAGTLGIFIGILSLIGYVWSVQEIITDRYLPPIAVPTAISFIGLGLGMLFTHESEPHPTSQGLMLAGVEIRILVGFGFALTLLMVAGSFTYRNTFEYASSIEWIAHTQEVRTKLADLYGSLAGAEVAQRDYFLTHDKAPLDESKRLIERVKADMGQLRPLVSDNPTQLKNLELLQPMVDNRLRTLNAGLVAFTDYGIPAVRAVLALSRNTSTVEDVGALRDGMDALETDLLAKRRAESAHVRTTTLAWLLVTLAAAVGLFVALFRSIHGEMLARRGMERALRASEQYSRNIIDNSPDCVCVLTTGAHILSMNPLGMQLMQIENFADITGRDWCTFWDGEDRSAAREAVAKARNGQQGHFTAMARTTQALEKWWDVIVQPIRAADGQPERLLAVARDATKAKEGEVQLRSANQFLDSLIQNLPVMIVVKDVETLRFVRVNRAFEEMLGYTRGELIGKGPHDLFDAAEADFVVLKDREALEQDRLIEIPAQTIHTAHVGARTFHTMKLPIHDADGKQQHLLAISVDITERKLAEEAIRELNSAMETKAAQLEATNKELESFSYSVSHDLRAPLRAIDGFAEIIEEDFKDKIDAEGKRYLSVIRQNSRRMGSLIDDLLSFSRLGRQTVTKSEVNMDSLVREVVDEIMSAEAGHAYHGGTPPTIEVDPLPPVFGDRTLLRQVWINLISNAVKYSSKSAVPHIEIKGSSMDGENLYAVRDNGVGFNMEYVNKLFGVFQRLHRGDEFSGTGVGLAIVQRIVTRHGGRVWAEGKINEGAVFSIALPKGVSGG